MPVIRMTSSNLATLQIPEGRSQIEWCDIDTPGLYLLATSNSNVSSFFYRYKIAGKTKHVKVGRLGDVTLAQARAAVKKLRAEIALGADPRGEEKARRAVLTFSEFIEGPYLEYVKPRKRSWKRDEELYRLRTKAAFGHLRLNQITRQQIQLFHTALFDQGLAPSHCDLYLRFIRHALNLAIDWNLLTEKNPAARIPLFNVDNRVENLLSDAELERLVTVLGLTGIEQHA